MIQTPRNTDKPKWVPRTKNEVAAIRVKLETYHGETRGETLERVLDMMRVGRWNELTKTWGRTKTIYTHTNERIRNSCSEAGEGQVRDRMEKYWKDCKTHRGRNWKAWCDTWGHNFTIKQEIQTCKKQDHDTNKVIKQPWSEFSL